MLKLSISLIHHDFISNFACRYFHTNTHFVVVRAYSSCTFTGPQDQLFEFCLLVRKCNFCISSKKVFQHSHRIFQRKCIFWFKNVVCLRQWLPAAKKQSISISLENQNWKVEHKKTWQLWKGNYIFISVLHFTWHYYVISLWYQTCAGSGLYPGITEIVSPECKLSPNRQAAAALSRKLFDSLKLV